MSPYRPPTVLVIGGIRSGKSEFAESLVSDAPVVRYVATAHLDTASAEPDDEWSARIEAHRQRRPAQWTTEEIGKTPDDLAGLIASASPDDTILVDDIGGWLAAILERSPGGSAAAISVAISVLANAVTATPARVVIVSPEVGLSVIPATSLGRVFADATGIANRALADACDGVALVIAGQAAWLKQATPRRQPGPRAVAGESTIVTPATRDREPAFAIVETAIGTESRAAEHRTAEHRTAEHRTAERRAAERRTADSRTAESSATESRAAERKAAGSKAAGSSAIANSSRADAARSERNPVHVGMSLPLPDDAAAITAGRRIAALAVPGAGLGRLAPVVAFAAGVQGTGWPSPFASVRVVTVYGRHAGAIAAGDSESIWQERLDETRAGTGSLAHLAAQVGATIEIVDAGTAAPIEEGDACSADDVDAALLRGWHIANAAADRGDDLIMLAAAGPGVDAAAAATVAAISRAEITTLLGRVWAPGGMIDDHGWMTRCVTIRDTLLRVRSRMSDGPHTLIAFGGPTIAFATGLLLGAAERRTPVMIDGPVGAAAAMTARDYAAQVRLWCLLADHGNHPTVRTVADMLNLTPVFDLRIGLGEGVNALAVLPLIQSALQVSTMDQRDTTDEPDTGDGPNAGDWPEAVDGPSAVNEPSAVGPSAVGPSAVGPSAVDEPGPVDGPNAEVGPRRETGHGPSA